MSKPKASNLIMVRMTSERSERGFSLLQLVISLAIIAIISGFAILGMARARDSIRLQDSMRQLAARVEKARLDAIRRHGSASVEFTSSNTYVITMDFEGTGTATERTFSLESNVIITNADGSAITELPFFDFDWRGRTTQCFTSIRMKNRISESSGIAVTSSGDITVDTNLGGSVSPGTYTTVDKTNDVLSGAIVSGNSPAPCIDPCGSCGSGSSPVSSTPPAGCGAFGVDKTLITIKRNGGSTDSFTITGTTADTIKVAQSDGRTNLEFLPSASQSVTAGGTKTFTVRSKNNSKGKFPVVFTSTCSSSNSVYATVSVIN